MKILLDTQSWLWMQVTPDRFGPTARDLIEDPDNTLLLSAASSWEIAIKYSLGKLHLPEPPASYVPSRLASGDVLALPVSHQHAFGVAALPPHHRDPFDRLLVACAIAEGVPLLTKDRTLDRYDVEVIPAEK